ncbi:hypothetical protein A4X13_0g9275, partial [Tilletia indica]
GQLYVALSRAKTADRVQVEGVKKLDMRAQKLQRPNVAAFEDSIRQTLEERQTVRERRAFLRAHPTGHAEEEDEEEQEDLFFPPVVEADEESMEVEAQLPAPKTPEPELETPSPPVEPATEESEEEPIRFLSGGTPPKSSGAARASFLPASPSSRRVRASATTRSPRRAVVVKSPAAKSPPPSGEGARSRKRGLALTGAVSPTKKPKSRWASMDDEF